MFSILVLIVLPFRPSRNERVEKGRLLVVVLRSMIAGTESTFANERIHNRRWPAYFDTSRAKELGFVDDVSLVETVKDYANSLKE